jgi:hypothetical protein
VAEELRLFLRASIYIAVAGTVYWLVSSETAGSVLLAALLIALVAFLLMGAFFGRNSFGDLRAPKGGVRGILGRVNRLIGFHERGDAKAPMEGGPELIPLASAWPVVTAAAIAVMGLGIVFGAWLLIPGAVLLLGGGLGWLTQLDDA